MFKASLLAFAVAIGINFGRIYRYMSECYPNFEKIKAQIALFVQNFFTFCSKAVEKTYQASRGFDEILRV